MTAYEVLERIQAAPDDGLDRCTDCLATEFTCRCDPMIIVIPGESQAD